MPEKWYLIYKKIKNCMFEKYQRVVLVTSSPDSVAILEKFFEKIISRVLYVFKKEDIWLRKFYYKR